MATGDERTRLWRWAVELYPSYADHQAQTEREIPVVVPESREAPRGRS